MRSYNISRGFMTTKTLLDKYFEILDKDYNVAHQRSNITQYLTWRGITAEQLLENGLQEQQFFDKLLKDTSLTIKKRSREIRILIVKKFMRFHGVPFKKYANYKKVWYYETDPAMKDFLIWCGNKPSTKKNANRFLYKYCQFRNKSPSKLLEEAKTLSKKEIEKWLKLFYDSLVIKSKTQVVSYIRKFYDDVAERNVSLPSAIKSYPRNELKFDEIIVTKEIVRKLLEGSDIRDSMIILASFDCPQNPADLVKLDYGDLKEFLNLENPELIEELAVIPMQREKTGKDGLYCFGYHTLRFMSQWLKYVQKTLLEWNRELTDTFPIFSMKNAPFDRLKVFNISATIRKICRKVNFKQELTAGDFRASWDTRAKPFLKEYDKELFMGHAGGVQRHYDRSLSIKDYFTNEYRKIWKDLFDITYDDVTVRNLESEYKEMKRTLYDVSFILENLFLSLPAGDTKLTREDIEKAVKKLRELK